MPRLLIDWDTPPTGHPVGYAKCQVCGRFCKNPRGRFEFTGTWNDYVIYGYCEQHGEQREGTV